MLKCTAAASEQLQLQSEAERFVEALQAEGEEEVQDEGEIAKLREQLRAITDKVVHVPFSVSGIY